MAEYTKNYKKIWKNKIFRKLSDDQKLLYLYLLSSPHSNTLGLYHLPKAYISDDLGWSSQKTAQNLAILLKSLIKYDEENKIILISSWLKYNPLTSDNHVKKAQAELSELSETTLDQEFIDIVENSTHKLNKKILDNAVGTAFERRLDSEEEEEEKEESKKEEETKEATAGSQDMNNDNGDLRSFSSDFAGSNEPLLKKIKIIPEIDELTILDVRLTSITFLQKKGYWNESEQCMERLDNFISKVYREAADKENPPGWFVFTVKKRLQENPDDFKPDRNEVDSLIVPLSFIKLE